MSLENVLPALEASGDLNRLFEKIVGTAVPTNPTTAARTSADAHGADLANKVEESRRGQQHVDQVTSEVAHATQLSTPTNYTVRIYSSPGGGNNNDKNGHPLDVQDQPAPWVITLDNFLTEDECDGLIRHGHGGSGRQQQHNEGQGEGSGAGFERSVDVGGHNAVDGTVYGRQSGVRTSETSWCTAGSGCRTAEIPHRIHQRISALLTIPPQHSEDFQILKYEVGQCTSSMFCLKSMEPTYSHQR
jgi:hypothetical protein